MFGHAYGWTIEQFLRLTLTQMHHLSNQIKKRITEEFHNHAQFHASIHGVKIKSLEELTDSQLTSPFSENDDKLFEEQAKKILEERRAAYGGK